MKRLVLVVYGSLLLVQLVHADSSGTVSLPWAKTGVSYNVQLVATVSGSSPFVFDLHAGDHLPPTFSLSTSGLLTGAPAAGAVQTAYTFTVDVKDATGSIAQSQPVSLTVSPSPQAVSLSVTSSENKLPWAVPGHSYEVQLSTTVSGQTPFTFELSAGSAPLPAGLTLDSDGTLKTANTGAANNYVFIVSVKDATGKIVQSMIPCTFTVSASPQQISLSSGTSVKETTIKFLQPPNDGATTVTVLGKPSTKTETVSVRLLSCQNQSKTCDPGTGIPLMLTGSKLDASTDSQGLVTLSLATPLQEGETLKACETVENTSTTTATASGASSSAGTCSESEVVQNTLDWGRVRAYFAGGALIANDQSSFSSSSASPFIMFNIEKTWLLAGCASITPANSKDPTQARCTKTGKSVYVPGLTTFFETRLTAIPVQPMASTSSSSASTTTTGGNLSSQKTARLGVGAYFPWVLTHWYYNNQPNGLFIGPLAKVGFDTLTGATSQTLISGASPVNFNRFYNHYGFGIRFGHYGLSKSQNKSPELISYLDVTLGPFTNLQSYICNPVTSKIPPFVAQGNDCAAYFPPGTSFTESRESLYRLDLEGILKIPRTIMFVGFNANVKALGKTHLDLGLQPNDDLRFLFGIKFDVATAMQKFGVQNK